MSRLPSPAVALLRWMVRDRMAREGLLGDLEERYAALGEPGRLTRLFWLGRELLAVVLGYAVDRLGRAGRRRGGRAGFSEVLLHDLRYAVRGFARRPGFGVIVVVTLAIAIGANTAVFSVVNAVLFRKAPFRDPDRLVRIYTRVPGFSVWGSSNYLDFMEMRALDDVFEDVGAYDAFFSRAEVGGESRRVTGESMSHNLFGLLGIDPALGRTFLPEEDRTDGAHPVVMLGHGYWERTFGGDPRVLGSTVRLAGQPFTVVGVMPAWHHGLSGPGFQADVFVPLTMSATAEGGSDANWMTTNGSRRFNVIGRLANGVGMETAAARLDALAARLREARPEVREARSYPIVSAKSVSVTPEIDTVLRSIAVLLMTVVGLVLLLSCANLASFLLARATARRREVAMRRALGASRARLVVQLLTETMTLAVLGGVAGVLLADWVLHLVMGFQPPLPVQLTLDLGMDGRVLLFTALVSIGTGLLFGAAPALQTTRPDVASSLRGEASAAGRGRLTLRNGLIAFQMAVSVILLVGGGLFLRSLDAARHADVGFRTRDAGVIWLDVSIGREDRSERYAVAEELRRRALAVSGVEQVSLAWDLPLMLSRNFDFVRIPGVDHPEGQQGHHITTQRVDHEYFTVMGIPVLAGRTFRESDRGDAPRVAIVNQTAARIYWPGESPLGKEVFLGRSESGYTIVGVVRDTRIERLGEPPAPLVYYPFSQRYGSNLYIVARGSVPAAAIVASLRQVVRDLDPTLVLMDAKTWDEQLGLLRLPGRMAALLLGVSGSLALFLAAVGLYGVVSFAASQRVREVGIRMSLGASRARVVRMVLGAVLGVVAVGGAAGLVAAALLAHLIRHFLYGVGPADPVTLVGVPLLLAAVATVAAFMPARRASLVHPLEALRRE